MKIWLFNHYAVAPGTGGGTRHYDLSKELAAKGCDVTIFASSFQHQTAADKQIPEPDVKVKEKSYEGVRFVWLKTNVYRKNDWRRVWNMFLYSFRAYRHALKRKERPDIVVGSLMHPLAALIGYLVAKKKGCPFYFEERDLWPQTLLDFGKVSKYNPVVLLLSALELFLYRKAKRIVLLFDKAHLYVEQRGISADKVVYLPNGVDLNRYDSPEPGTALPQEVERRLQALEGQFIAVYTGSHGVSDNLDVLLEAASVLHKRKAGIHFLFAGNGPMKEKLMQTAKNSDLTNVTFISPIDKNAIPLLLKRSHAGLISLKDAGIYKWGMSFNKLYDYMAASLPTLVLGKKQVSTLEQAEGGLLAQSPEELAQTLCQLRDNELLRRSLGSRARAYAEKHHSWKTLAETLHNVLKHDAVQQQPEQQQISNKRGLEA
ncbi:glycosyltransferase family 4 protein [Paenibacillus contaminans]|uniref:Glycosyltransferase WbuB n=1 Tax=Paenibacillus contaminans TaxID=450362 RepID=A0A329MW83_9BACL|nr:glycosyltransferase family 4 protein [Paenibacillus contaminans]RAV22117.1 glycosyltransferase WbuB [Paenibacillus contaminans]